MDTHDRADRTWLCTVIFMDLVGYSRQSVSQQLRIKEEFNSILTSAIAAIPPRDRIILDTGDGAAICFLGDPEDVLFAALSLRAAFAGGQEEAEHPFAARIGVNLGPVKLIRDVNGSMNAIGDGINVAQRIMSFAEPNCILVSRSFYEVVGCLSDEYSRLFEFDGTREDKHTREHTVYKLEMPGGGAVPVPHSAKPAPPVAVPAELIQRLEAELTETLGPVARVLVRRAAMSATNPGDLIRQIAEELPETPARNAFLARHSGQIDARKVPAPSASRSPGETNTATTASLEELLAEYVGPLSRILVRRAAAKAANSDELISLLKAEITDPKEQAAFCKRAEKYG